MATDRVDILVRVRNAASTTLKKLRGDFGGVEQGANRAGSAVSSLGRRLVVLAGAYIGLRVVKDVVQTFAEFDDAMRAAAAVTNATSVEMVKMRGVAKELGATTRFTARQAADGLRLLGMAGFTAAEATEALPGVLNLAAAGMVEVSSAADIATNILQAFGLDVQQLGRVNDVLVSTFTNSNTTVLELGEAFKLVGPIAKGVGANFEELFATIGKLGDAGLKGTLAGTALRGAINALLNPTKEEQMLMGELAQRMGGVSLQLKDSEGDFIGFVKVIEQLEAAGLRGDEALRLFGLRAGPGMAALMQVGSKALREFYEQQQKAGGVSDRIASQMESGIGGAMRRYKAAAEGVKTALGETFNDDLITAIDAVTAAFRRFIDWVTDQKVQAGLQTLGGRLSNFAKDFFELLNEEDLSNFPFKKKTLQDQLDEQVEIVQKASDKLLKLYKSAEDPNAFKLRKEVWNRAKQEYEVIEVGTEKEIAKWTAIVQAGMERQAEIQEQMAAAVPQGILKSMSAAYAEVNKLNKKLEQDLPIGKGKNGEEEEVVARTFKFTPTPETNIKREEEQLKALIEWKEAVNEKMYAKGMKDMQEYYDARAEIVRSGIEKEISLLEIQAAEFKSQAQSPTEGEDPSKAAQQYLLVNSKIKVLRIALDTELHKLDLERFKKEEDLNNERVRNEQDLNNKRLAMERAFAAQKLRIEQYSGYGLEPEHNKELADLQTRQDAELNAITSFWDKKYSIEQEGQNRSEVLAQIAADKLNAVYAKQSQDVIERTNLVNEQTTETAQKRLKLMGEVAGGVSSIFQNMYELSGSKNQELFRMAKALAIAEATMNLAVAISAVIKKGTIGLAEVGTITAKGAQLLATINSASLAEGGFVPGRSPTNTSDDKLVAATSGEFMQPVSSVDYYGARVMEGLRQKTIPREIFSGFNFPAPRYGHSHFAEGGMVQAGGNMNPQDIAVRLENNSREELEVTQGDVKYDQQLKKFVIDVYLDAKRRNVSGMRGA